MASVEALCRDLISRYSIPACRVVGHSDIAPDRKIDPGELFDWPRLARNGIGIWPSPNPPEPGGETDIARMAADLTAIGYCTTADSLEWAVVAFQRRFRPRHCDGRFDRETAARLAEVRAAFERSRAAPKSVLDVEVQNSP